jgi:thiol-disulfide isomerase/thioredoxin
MVARATRGSYAFAVMSAGRMRSSFRSRIGGASLAAVLALAGRARAAPDADRAPVSAPKTAGTSALAAPVTLPTIAELSVILAAARAPGARAVLINVWATWCDPCREELPDVIRFYRDHRGDGLRLVLVSADDEDARAEVAQVLAAAGLPAGTPSFIKTGDDMRFIDGLDKRWSGALPASFLLDGQGRQRRWWAGPVSYALLAEGLAGLLPASPTPLKDPTKDTTSPRRHP